MPWDWTQVVCRLEEAEIWWNYGQSDVTLTLGEHFPEAKVRPSAQRGQANLDEISTIISMEINLFIKALLLLWLGLLQKLIGNKLQDIYLIYLEKLKNMPQWFRIWNMNTSNKSHITCSVLLFINETPLQYGFIKLKLYRVEASKYRRKK